MVNARIALDELTINNLKQFHMIQERSLENPKLEEFGKFDTKLAYCNDICVGGIATKQTGEVVRIMTLAVLEKYRSLGIGKKLVEFVIEKARNAKPTALEKKPTSIVVEKNDYFLQFGFTETDEDLELTL